MSRTLRGKEETGECRGLVVWVAYPACSDIMGHVMLTRIGRGQHLRCSANFWIWETCTYSSDEEH